MAVEASYNKGHVNALFSNVSNIHALLNLDSFKSMSPRVYVLCATHM